MGFFKKLFKKEHMDQPVKERNYFTIQINDIISYDLEDYQVVGKLTYQDHGFKWYAYQLQGEGRTLWLSVELDDELELGMYERIPLKVAEPIPKELEVDGVKYYLDEKGKAQVKGEGRGQNVDGMTVAYFDYYDEEEENALSVEKWGSEVEVSKGWEIEDYEVKIIASS